MKLTIAYGLPASGKTTLLKSLKGEYLDYDSPNKRYKVKGLIKSLCEGDYIIDFMLFKPNDFVKFYFDIHPKGSLTIYQFKEDRILSNLRDKKRNRNVLSTNVIDNMKLEKIKANNLLKVVKV